MGKSEQTGTAAPREELLPDGLPAGQLAWGGALLLVLALLLGVLVGLGTFAALRLADGLQDLLWDRLPGLLPAALQPLFPLAFCTVGGLVVGLWTRRCGYTLETLGQVMARVRQEGGYRLRSLPKTLVLFLLPIAFGGAVGPEAGITGFAAAGFTAALGAMRRTGRAMADDPAHLLRSAARGFLGDGGEGRLRHRWAKALAWAVAGVGFALGARILTLVLGPSAGLPRFAPIDYLGLEPASAVAAAASLALASVMALFLTAAGRLASRVGGHWDVVGRAIVCGLALGAVACLLPDVLFSGQGATGQLIGSWQEVGAAILLATAFAKLALSKLCVASGWVGGEFFPLILCGVSGGYAVAALLGVDPLLPVAVCAGCLVGASTGKALLTTAVLALCFPPASLPVVLAAAWVGARLPRPTGE